jgi:hypothetical protein
LDTSSLSDNELSALKAFNTICSELRGDYSKTAQGLYKLWFVTLSIYLESFCNFNSLLFDALMKRRPHWKNEIDKFSSNTNNKLNYYFCKSALSLDVFSGGEIYTGSPFQSYIGGEHSESGYCLVHPTRQVAKQSGMLCHNCLSKLERLQLTDYPIDYGLLYVLKIRVRYKNAIIPRCVNHPTRIALGNGLCSNCNRTLGQLSEELDKAGLKHNTGIVGY